MSQERRRWVSGLAALVALGSLASPADAGLLAKARLYRSTDLFGTGYSSKLRPDGTWKIVANTRSDEGRGFAFQLAMYRAAEVATESGKRYFQVLDANGSVVVRGYSVGAEYARIFVRASDDPAPPTDCRSKRPDDCRTLEAERVMARLGATMEFKVKPLADAHEAR
ncbi:hypothetical protein KX816_08910 [Sphingosinicellaceae bacterium]|nr:hypothetical protein KX816_08910 [Sphingosinicellaceae bacterium]